MAEFTAPNDAVLFEQIDEHVALVTLNRPEKRNAVNGEIASGMDAIVRHIEESPDLWVAVLASSNDKVFCAGADLQAISEGRGLELETKEGGFAGFVYYPRTKPWIAAPRGSALGGGLELCLACDMIVAAADCRFGLPEVKRSLLAGAGGLSRLPNAIPVAIAVEMIVTGEPIDAARAYALGLVNQVVPAGQQVDAAVALARLVAGNAPIAVRESMAIAKEAAIIGDRPARDLVMPAYQRIFPTEDFNEGPRAFVEKRAPVWKNR
jgi:enoyl-CoA hydratase